MGFFLRTCLDLCFNSANFCDVIAASTHKMLFREGHDKAITVTIAAERMKRDIFTSSNSSSFSSESSSPSSMRSA